MGKHRDWGEIEKDYLESDLSYSQLAKKYGVSISSLKKAASRQGWAKKKSEMPNPKAERAETALAKVEPVKMEPGNGTNGAIDRVLEREADRQRFQRIVDGMLDRVEEAICAIDPHDAGSIKLLTGALKDLRDLKHLNRTELDIEEQRARIEKLKMEVQYHDVSSEQVIVEFVNTEGAEV